MGIRCAQVRGASYTLAAADVGHMLHVSCQPSDHDGAGAIEPLTRS
jgi:hypothetical protein